MFDIFKYNNIYKFYNTDNNGQISWINLNIWGMPYYWINNLLEDYTSTQIVEIFEYIRRENNWHVDDLLVASNEIHDVFYTSKGNKLQIKPVETEQRDINELDRRNDINQIIDYGSDESYQSDDSTGSVKSTYIYFDIDLNYESDTWSDHDL
jgi:hypothetical protein